MHRFALLGLALAGLLSFAPDARPDKVLTTTTDKVETFKPTAVLRLKPLDGLIDDLKYLVKQTQREQVGKQVEGILKGLTGPNGLEGVDTKKPIGIYASLNAKLDQSEVMLLVPVADEKDFLTFLENLDFKVEKGKDGLHTLSVENVPFPILFRFAHGYAYGTLKFAAGTTVPEAGKLPKPEDVLGKEGGLVSLTANLDRMPEQIRKLAVSAAALQLGNMKDEAQPNETEAQKELRGAMLDELSVLARQLIEEGGPVSLQIDVDQKNHDLSLSFTTAGKPDSALAKNIAAVSKSKGLAALVGKESAMGGALNVALPASVIKQLAPVVDEGFKKGLEALDENTRKLVEPLVKALDGTAKAGSLDIAVDLRGPNKNGKYAFVAGLGVKDGDKIEEALKKVIGELPEEAKKPFGLDADKAEGVAIHRVEQKNPDENTRELLGDGPMYFAVRKDAVLIALGEDALPALKAALATKPTESGPAQLEVSLARIASVISKTRKNATEAAKKAFVEKDSDKVTLSIDAGKELTVKFRVKTAVLTFASLLDAEEKKAAEQTKKDE